MRWNTPSTPRAHLTGQPTADDVVVREPVPFEDPGCFTPGTALSAGEIEHFKTHGFIVKRGLIHDSQAFRQIADHLWANVPRNILRRDEPASWLDGAEAQWTDDDVARVGRLIHTNWKMRSPGPSGIGTEPFLVERIANHPNVLAVAQAFLGAPIKPPRRVRGIYGGVPEAPRGARSPRPPCGLHGRPVVRHGAGPRSATPVRCVHVMARVASAPPPALGHLARRHHVSRQGRWFQGCPRRRAARHHSGRVPRQRRRRRVLASAHVALGRRQLLGRGGRTPGAL